MTAAALGEPQVIWDEHQSWRGTLTDSPSPTAPTMSRDEHLALAHEIERRLKAAGVIH